MDGDPFNQPGRGLAGGGRHPAGQTYQERGDRIYADALNAYRAAYHARMGYQYPEDCWLPEGQIRYSVDRDTWLPPRGKKVTR